MLLREQDGAVVAIGQASHAWLSGQLARAWGNRRFGAVEPFEEVCLGAEQHDVGLAQWDREPELNPQTGYPYSFLEMPLESHAGAWSGAAECLLTQSRYAALLVSMHGSTLYERRNLDALNSSDAALARQFLRDQRQLQARLLEGLRADPATAPAADASTVDRNRRLVFAWDHLSLALCLGWAPTTIRAVPTPGGPVEIALDSHADRAHKLEPWPFRTERVELRCEGRRLPRRCADETALAAALESADWVTLTFELRPADA